VTGALSVDSPEELGSFCFPHYLAMFYEY
jgi:hypothetical protein